jgi:predicted amidophosphoribosyltransferase
VSARPMPRWVRAVRKALLAQPGITELPVCAACHRTMAPADMVDDTCRDCHRPASDAFHFDGSPFMPWDDDD